MRALHLLLACCCVLVGARGGALSAARDSAVVPRASSGPSLEEGPDGSWLQRVQLHGQAQPGWAGLRAAFTRQVVTVDCPSSTAFNVTVSSWRGTSDSSGTASMGWQTVQHCGTRTSNESAAAGGLAASQACTVGVTMVGDSMLMIQQPGGSTIPEPCVLTLEPGTSPVLVLASALGIVLLLHGPRLARASAVRALIRVTCIVLPIFWAVIGCIALAAVALMSTAWIEALLSVLPPAMQPLKDAWGSAVVSVAALTGVGICLALLLAYLATQLRGVALAIAPRVTQALGAALICSNSSALNWVVRTACIAWLLRSHLGWRSRQAEDKKAR